MKLVFADAYYLFGLLSPRDSAHAACIGYSKQNDPPLISTAWVFTELADGIGRTEKRQVVQKFLEAFEKQEGNIFVPATNSIEAAWSFLTIPPTSSGRSPTASRSW